MMETETTQNHLWKHVKQGWRLPEGGCCDHVHWIWIKMIFGVMNIMEAVRARFAMPFLIRRIIADVAVMGSRFSVFSCMCSVPYGLDNTNVFGIEDSWDTSLL